MSIDTLIGECQELADRYIEAMRQSGIWKAREIDHGYRPHQYHAAKEAWQRLILKTHALDDLGRGDLSRMFLESAVRTGSDAEKDSLKEEIRSLAEA